MLKIGLLWHSTTSDNLGVGALTEAQISIINKAAVQAGVEVEYRIFGTNGNKDYFEGNPLIERGTNVSLKRILIGASDYPKKIRECDVVFDIGEGDSFADIYGFSRFLIQIVSKLVVLFQRKPLILSPQTIGPFESRFNLKVANNVMQRCTKIFVRDGLSFGYLQKNNLSVNAEEVIDVAFRLPFQRPSRDSSKVKIGLNVSGLLYNGGYTGKNQFGLSVNYPELTRSLLDQFTRIEGCEVWLVPHVLTTSFPIEDDVNVCVQLQELYPAAKLAPSFSSPSQAKSFISGMDFFLGARMHACIAAFSSGVPVVPLAYSRKFNGLFSALDYPYLGDCKVNTNEQIVGLVMDCFNSREQLKFAVEEGNKIAEKKLLRYEQYIAELLTRISNKKIVL
ncbi:polysaccharide pyruvyl transferase family protein [Methylobacillus flagellatus]|uniref:Polysaccharide pyruvyl transferase n=1 Tax=Methylobacillus flagellatus (strain ATCC 51484 / DSM 6875 / VKM B-1610 / KT) TaxID=265072 RepID=Q1GZQ0_METFK|nr:polysaccharide pyruvyl transferase family protein [Methylobacillus flagellatus]ABE50287.1 polysaccharide pyruvyl transferase [Methylobacillus flagellatus KT]